MQQNNNYNKKLKPLARNLRTASTKAEVRLWCELLRQGQTGYTFLRQRPIANYIADFMCKELKLVIEVDGYSHNFKTEEDQHRDKELATLGFTTMRFSDEEVMKGLPNVERVIREYITRFEEQNRVE